MEKSEISTKLEKTIADCESVIKEYKLEKEVHNMEKVGNGLFIYFLVMDGKNNVNNFNEGSNYHLAILDYYHALKMMTNNPEKYKEIINDIDLDVNSMFMNLMP